MVLYPVKISYARLDIISIQFKIIVVAYAESVKETQSQDRHNIFPGKPLRRRKPSQNFLCIRCITYNPQNRYSPPFVMSLSLSLLCATQVSESVFK